MKSPFTEFLPENENDNIGFQIPDELEVNSPFLNNQLEDFYATQPSSAFGLANSELSDLTAYMPIDWNKAVNLNQKYSTKLGWNKYIADIQGRLLKTTGISAQNVDTIEFANALAKWQLQNGFLGDDIDGAMGPKTWERMQSQLNITGTSHTPSTLPSSGIDPKTVSKIRVFDSIIEITSQKYSLNPNIVRGIIAAESGGNARTGEGRSGYKGLMQAEKTEDQLDPGVSIDAGVKKFVYFRDKILNPWFVKLRISIPLITDENYLKACLSCYNAGPVTALKAIQYAHQSGNWRQWFSPENYKRALVFSGGYAQYADCNTGKSTKEIDDARTERLKYRFKTSSWRNEPDPASWSNLYPILNPTMRCWIETKYRNSPGYLDKFIRYYKYFQANPVSNEIIDFESNEDLSQFETPLTEDEGVDESLQDWHEPEMENEMSRTELKKAVELNERYKKLYKWEAFVWQIGKEIGVPALEWPSLSTNPEKFALAFANWQDKIGAKTTLKGVFGLNNWTYFQKKLGFHNLSNKHKIDVNKAISGNKYYAGKYWGSEIDKIYQRLGADKIVNIPLPLNDEYFAYAVADFQALKGLKIDGSLGPNSWSLLKSFFTGVSLPATPVQKRSDWHNIITNTVPCPAYPLVNGKITFEHMVSAIKTATTSEHYIYILGWMLDVDFELIPGVTLIQLLQEASKNGVQIRVLIWDNPYYIKEISTASGKINSLNNLPKGNAVLIKDNATFGSPGIKSAISKIRVLLSQAPVFLRFINSWNSFVSKVNIIQNEGSHHEKVLVVKGKEGLIGFCGGIDFNKNRVTGIDSWGKSEVLHDIHCELRGHAAWVLLHRFIWRWQVYKSQHAGPPLPRLFETLLGEGETRKIPSAVLPAANVAHVKILQTYNHPVKNIKDRSIREAVRLAIMNAKKSVYIEDQYMISLEIASWLNSKLDDPNFNSVTILTQDDSIAGQDIKFPVQMRKKFIDELEKGLSPDKKKKIYIKMLPLLLPPLAHHKVHSKTYIIDDELAIIGSANLSSRSMTHDSETAAIIFNDPGAVTNFASQLKSKIDADPDTKKEDYAPNPKAKDMDVQIIDELNNLSTAKRIALQTAFPTISILIPEFIKMLVTQFKPAIIDIIDPDADDTQPQQELEGWPETFAENEQLYNETDMTELSAREIGFVVPADMEEFPERNNSENEHEMISYNTELEQKDMNSYNEQTIFDNSEWGNNAPYRLEDKEVAEVIENQVALAQASGINTKPCEGRTCWAKTILNNQLALTLPANNTLDEETKKAIAIFQTRKNIQLTQKIDSLTERHLLEADALQRGNGTVYQAAANSIITAAKAKIEDWTKQAVNNKPQHILNSYRDPRKIYAFVLHHMAFKRKSRKTGLYSDPNSYLSTGAHFCIMLDGRIIQLHAMSRMIWHGNCLSPRSVAVEFEGNFPNVKGKWWIDKESSYQNKDNPTQAQFDSGRFLISYLKIVLGTTHIFAHRQSSASRENDPGPDIWFNVGQWAIEKLKLTDGGPTFKCGTGNPILPEWRTWGIKKVQQEQDEYARESEEEDFNEDFEEDNYETEYESDGEYFYSNQEAYLNETDQIV